MIDKRDRSKKLLEHELEYKNYQIKEKRQYEKHSEEEPLQGIEVLPEIDNDLNVSANVRKKHEELTMKNSSKFFKSIFQFCKRDKVLVLFKRGSATDQSYSALKI